MALASGVRSSLNPNAPIFVPAALRQVEDFSPEWWDLVTTSTWFRDYWLSEHSEEDILGIGDDFDNQEVVDLLPDTFDLCADDDFLGLDAQFDEFIQYSDSLAAKRLQGGDALKNLTVARTTKERLAKCSFEPKAWEKPPQRVTTKCSPRRIQQPR